MRYAFAALTALLLAPLTLLHAAGPGAVDPDPPAKNLPLPGEVFLVAERTAFLIPAKVDPAGESRRWVWYAPTLPNLPGKAELWMFERFREAGIAIAGIDVGESFGSPAGSRLFTSFYEEMTESRGYSHKPVLLGRSRGGLMTLSWAAGNPERVAAFAGVYPVCNLASYPGVAKASGAYGMKSEELQAHLTKHNPIDRLAALAKAGVPLFAIHGDVDRVVPLDANSGLMKQRYTTLGGNMQLIVPRGQGHNMWSGFFRSQELVNFVKTHAGPALTLALDDLFPRDRVLDVQITVAEEDWDTIRYQSRDFFSALGEARKQEPTKGPYTYVEASVTIDGVQFPGVGLRKKGFLGSLSTTRPSLKIKLNRTDSDGAIGGLKNLTLNNNQQDSSLVSQFMGYALFNAAGSPAPRCAYASVTVNGKNLGIYSHVETIRKPLLAREFGDDGGTLYEGTVVDFYDDWEGSFERKFGDDKAGRKKIERLIGALNGSGGAVILGAESEGRVWAPTSGELDDAWMAVDFDDSSWVKGRGGAGFETGSGYETLIGPGFDLKKELHEQQGSIYMRIPFKVDHPDKVTELTLRMKFDDGFVAYINGHRVTSANAPEKSSWRSRATGQNDDSAAVTFQPFYISGHIDKLRKGDNLLAIQGLNAEPSSSDLLIVAELRSSDTGAHQAIADLVELASFYSFWAIESLLGFWDGYSGNKNNFFVYLNPRTGKFHFIPWGADSMFEKFSKINPDRRKPLSVKTEGLIAHRLYQMPSGRERYLKTLLRILDKHWDEEKLLAETDRIEALLEPYVKDIRHQHRFSASLDRVREFIRTRREDITRETANGMPIWTKPPSEPPVIPADAGGFGRFGKKDDDETDLWSAARDGDIESIDKQLAAGADMNAKDGLGSTALSWAAGLGRFDAVKFLIEKGADVNARNKDGTTPLDGTAEEMQEEAVDFLFNFLKVKIDVEEVNAAKPRIAELLRKHGGKPGAAKGGQP